MLDYLTFWAALSSFSLLPGLLPVGASGTTGEMWQVSLIISVSGTYAAGPRASGGEYRYSARWDGWLEKDEDDFIVYQTGVRTLEWKITNESGKGCPAEVTRGKEIPEEPELRLNFVSREGTDIFFEYEISSISELLPLPAFSSDEGSAGRLYLKHVTQGTAIPSIPVSALKRPSYEKKFNWQWRERRRGPAGRVYFTSGHAAVIEILIRPVGETYRKPA